MDIVYQLGDENVLEMGHSTVNAFNVTEQCP